MDASPISVFVSYSRDSEEHVAWVTRLANALEERPDFHVVFDAYDLMPGGDVTHFMEEALRSDRVIVVITPMYVEKAVARRGGVGYESAVISGELLTSTLQDTYIPVLRSGTIRPSFLQTKLYIDFSKDDGFDAAILELSNALLRRPRVARPAKRTGAEATLQADDGTGTRLRERYKELRGVLGTVPMALEEYADVVYALLRAGRWSTVIGVAEPAELTHAEAQARRTVRLYNSKLSNAIITTRHVILNARLSDGDQAVLGETLNALTTLEETVRSAERAVAEIRHGKSPKRVFDDHTEVFEDREGKLRLLLGKTL